MIITAEMSYCIDTNELSIEETLIEVEDKSYIMYSNVWYTALYDGDGVLSESEELYTDPIDDDLVSAPLWDLLIEKVKGMASEDLNDSIMWGRDDYTYKIEFN